MPLTKTQFLLPSTIQLLRFPFSLFLMPVYWFALSQVPAINLLHALFSFIILHLLVYPASNGYNSYMDRDTGSIGGIKHPLQPTRQLLYSTVVMDSIAILLSCLISPFFVLGVLLYILASKAYSFRGIRLKKYPVTGYLTVMLFQGGLTFALVYHGCSMNKAALPPYPAMLAAGLLIGGFYPLTQIYQHQADLKDGVKTISYLLGFRGTFIFSAMVYTIAVGVLGWYFVHTRQLTGFFLFCISMLPVAVYFISWAAKVWQNEVCADYTNTIRMNIIASVCSNLAFILIFIARHFEQNH